jgi:hypothetical protein
MKTEYDCTRARQHHCTTTNSCSRAVVRRINLFAMRFIAGLILVYMSVSVCRAQSSAIRGKAPDYAGKEISLYTYTDPVLHQKQELAQTRINPDGTFYPST